jgi:DNA-3-methyladenine glycosylase
MPRILGPRFYHRKTDEVARRLLGCTLVHIVNGQRLAGRIVETEAYMGIEDPACHTFGDRRTLRTKSMYLDGGHAYVYLIYGMHFCFNVVTRAIDVPEAVLIRAVEPTEGIEVMRELRNAKSKKVLKTSVAKLNKNLANGPGKLCQALAIDRSCDGLPLTNAELFIEEGQRIDEKKIIAGPRIGVAYAGIAAAWPLRFTC